MSKSKILGSVSGEELAEIFGCSDRLVRQLTEDGIAVRVGHGRYDADASTTNYINHLRNTIVLRRMGIYDR
jgi:phage terminase Nu1 subunit (DNA packaging protein)